jgi:hypothetical protein
MWRLYSRADQGIAITTSRQALKGAVETEGYVIDVKYIDFISGNADIRIPTDVFEYKRRAFAHEAEVRAIITHYPQAGFERGMPCLSRPVEHEEYPEEGYAVDVDLEQLINKIVVSPSAANWYFEAVRQLVMKYELSEQLVAWSNLRAAPVYARMGT